MDTRFLGGIPTPAGAFRLVGLAAVMLAGIAAGPVQADYIVSQITPTSPGSQNAQYSMPSIDRGLATYLANTIPCGFGCSPGYQQVLVTQASTGVTVNVADVRTTVIPGTSGARFDYFQGVPSIDTGQVAFIGGTSDPLAGNNRLGMYLATPEFGGAGYSLMTIVNGATSVPGGTGTFSSYGSPFIANGDLVFMGTDSAGKTGIYKLAAGQTALQLVANENTPVPFVNTSTIPGTAGNFSFFSPYPTVSNGVVAFAGASSGRLPDGREMTGLFFADVATGAITARADSVTGLSGLGTNNVQIVTSPTISAGSAVFLAGFSIFPNALYTALYLLPQNGQGGPILPGGQQFQSWPGLDFGLVALLGSDQTIFSNLGNLLGLPAAVLRVGDTIDSSGTTYYGFMGRGTGGVGGDIGGALFHQSADYESGQIAFRAYLGPPGSDILSLLWSGQAYEAILVMSVVSEPTSLAMFVVGLLGLAGVNSARRRRPLRPPEAFLPA